MEPEAAWERVHPSWTTPEELTQLSREEWERVNNLDLYKRTYYMFNRQAGKRYYLYGTIGDWIDISDYVTEEGVPLSTPDKIKYQCDRIKNILINKNEAYGNSALDPIRIFSKADNLAQLQVRIDDKLSRLKRGHEYGNDDTIDDLIGYLILLKIALEEK